MQTQGIAPVNVQYFANAIQQTSNLVAQINFFKNNNFEKTVIQAVETELLVQLQQITNQIIPSILGQLNAVAQAEAKMALSLPLLTAPVTTLPQVTAFLTLFQGTALAQQLAPYANLVSSLVSLGAQLAELTSAIQSAAATISNGGTVSIPGSPQVQSPETVNVQFVVTRV